MLTCSVTFRTCQHGTLWGGNVLSNERNLLRYFTVSNTTFQGWKRCSWTSINPQLQERNCEFGTAMHCCAGYKFFMNVPSGTAFRWMSNYQILILGHPIFAVPYRNCILHPELQHSDVPYHFRRDRRTIYWLDHRVPLKMLRDMDRPLLITWLQMVYHKIYIAGVNTSGRIFGSALLMSRPLQNRTPS